MDAWLQSQTTFFILGGSIVRVVYGILELFTTFLELWTKLYYKYSAQFFVNLTILVPQSRGVIIFKQISNYWEKIEQGTYTHQR